MKEQMIKLMVQMIKLMVHSVFVSIYMGVGICHMPLKKVFKIKGPF